MKQRIKSIGAAAAGLTVLLLITLTGCLSTPAGEAGSAADTGILTRQEMESAARNMAGDIGLYFRNAGDGTIKDVFVALLGTRNETSQIIDTDLFDYALVEEMQKEGIFTVRTEDREAAIEEMKFNLSGLAEETLSLGNMKSPNYFIKTLITENFFHRDADRIIEQTIRVELRSVETQVVVWSDAITYTKKLARRNNNVAW